MLLTENGLFLSLSLSVSHFFLIRWLNGFNWDGLKVRKLTSPLKREVLALAFNIFMLY